MTMTSGRLLRLLSLLQARRYWPGDELADRLEVSGRTIRRDVERLRELGYPVDATTGPDGGYRLEAGTAMPPLLLDDDEAVAIAVGLRTAAGAAVDGIEETSVRALVKLEQVLPPHLRRRVNALGTATSTLRGSQGGPQADPEVLTVIAGACRDHECLRFAYKARDGVQTRRHVEPVGLVNVGRRWYVVTWDRERSDWRSFRLDRIAGVPSAGGRFEPRELPGGVEPATWVSENLAEARYAHEAVVTLHAPAHELEARHRWARGQVRPIDERSCSYTPSDDSIEWLALRIAFLGVDFQVHEPLELAEQCAALGRRFAAAAGQSSEASTRTG